MANLNDLLVKREESYIFFQTNVIPVHPYVLEKFKEKRKIDYCLFNKSLDGALEWTYQDIKDHPKLIAELIDFFSPFQTKECKLTKDIEVIRSWLDEGKHEYFIEEKGNIYTGKDLNSAPISGLHLKDSGIYVGLNPIIIIYDHGFISKNTLNHFGKDELLTETLLKEFEIKENEGLFFIPAVWYTKDGQPLVKLFGKNFAMNYTNLMIEKKYTEKKK